MVTFSVLITLKVPAYISGSYPAPMHCPYNYNPIEIYVKHIFAIF